MVRFSELPYNHISTISSNLFNLSDSAHNGLVMQVLTYFLCHFRQILNQQWKDSLKKQN